jgi:Zn-finger nucleic acid-binding protein
VPYREAPSQPHTGRRCPRCKAGLSQQALGPTRIERCASCHGVWIAAAEFNQLLRDLDRLEAVRARELAHHEPERTVSYVACPRCSEIMERRNFGRSSGIMVDTCKRHGIWLDRGELRRVAEHLTERANAAGASGPEGTRAAPDAAPVTRRATAPADRDPGVSSGQPTLLDALIELLTWPFT